MKKYIAYILLTFLLLSCFAGCKQVDKVTPTNATNTDLTPTESVNETALQEPNDTSDDTIYENSADEAKNENKTNVSEVKKDNQEVSSKTKQNKPTTNTSKSEQKNQPTQSKAEQSTVSANDIHAMPDFDEPNFLSETGFRMWLTQGSGQYEDERNTALQQATNQKFVYYRPANDLSKYGELSGITYFTEHNYINYEYKKDGTLSLEMVFNLATETTMDQHYETEKAAYEANKKGHYYTRLDGIDYYYTSNRVFWKQFGHLCVAFIYQSRINAEEIIPLLKSEQVTINLNSDHVTQ